MFTDHCYQFAPILTHKPDVVQKFNYVYRISKIEHPSFEYVSCAFP